MKAAVVKETAPGECRVALVPDALAKLRPAGIDVLVERDAGASAWLTDSAYADAGATIVSTAELFQTADVILTVTKPSAAMVDQLSKGQAIIGMLAPLTDPELAATLAAKGVTAVSLDGLPRTLSRAQPMDALSSQSNVAGVQGRPGRRGRVRQVLPDADHRGGHRPARQGARARRRRGPACRRSAPRGAWARW